jgi:DNA modification methylase
MMSFHLKYYWTAAYLTPGQPTPLRQRQVNSTWKPILIYSPSDNNKGKIFGDVYTSDKPEKDNHEWGQSVSGMLSIISQICLAGQSIFDPFLGSGSTGVAALQHGCLFHGIDIDEQSVNISKKRLAEVK